MVFYNLLLYFLFPFALLRLFSKKEFNTAELKRIKERFGAKDLKNCIQPIWIHAVSVGEVKVAALLIKELKSNASGLNFLVTTTTVAGSREFNKLFGPDVAHQYLPFDLNGFTKKFVDKINPKCLILVETEIWPNLINNCFKNRIPIFLLNGRMSDRSLRKYKKLKNFFKKIFSKLDLVISQSQKDLENFEKLGVKPNSISIDYSLKFSNFQNENHFETIEILPSRFEKKVIVCASTHPKEEAFLVETFLKLDSKKFHMVLIPRHIHRSSEISEILSSKKIDYEIFTDSLNLDVEVTLVDRMGFVETFFSVGDIAFVGGTLIPHGGQNFLEAVKFGLPIYSGSSTYNFEEISEDLQSLRILNIIDSIEDLALKWKEFSYNPQIKELSQNYLLSRQGAVERSVEKLTTFLKV